jgi:hypothetical protein
MSYFRLYVFDNQAHAILSFDLIAADYAVAVDRARRALHESKDAIGFELWQSAPRRQGEMRRKWLLTSKEFRDETRKSA